MFGYCAFLQAHPIVAQKLRYLIKRWAELPEFKEDAALRYVVKGSNVLCYETFYLL